VRHLDQAVAEPGGRNARDGPPERPAAPASRRAVRCLLASFRAGLGEVEVLDHDRSRPVVFRGGDKAADGCPQPPIPCSSGQADQVEGDGDRDAEDIAVRADDGDGQVPGVDVDGHHRGLSQLAQWRRRLRGRAP
jgi:hypothetical protein